MFCRASCAAKSPALLGVAGLRRQYVHVLLRKLIDMISRKKRLATRVARDIQYQAMMEIWLYFHVPISFGLLAALTGHIVSSFFYW